MQPCAAAYSYGAEHRLLPLISFRANGPEANRAAIEAQAHLPAHHPGSTSPRIATAALFSVINRHQIQDTSSDPPRLNTEAIE